jgi:glucose/arabinose dehydrogenase
VRVNSRRAGVFCCVALPATLISACAALASPKLDVPPGFTIESIASVGGARELAALPNGDLVVATNGRDLYLVPNAESNPGQARVLASLPDDLAAGVTFVAQRSELLVATTHHVWAIADPTSGRPLQPRRIADVRSGPVAPGTDGDVHNTTSLAFSKGLVYVSAGSSCNARMNGGASPCVEPDPTRAAVSVMEASGSEFHQRAKRLRNGIALAVNPQSNAVWVGGAGQDDLAFGHPYEFLDDLSAHAGVADYGWPLCEENHHAYWPGADCSHTVAPLIVLPAYSTIIGATFYPLSPAGPYAFPARYRGGLFATAHGSWHRDRTGCYVAPPRVVFIPMKGDVPVKPVDWTNPATQWTDFVTGFQSGCLTRAGRPTGIAVGSRGSLFVADDASGAIYRIRPTRSR